MQKFLSNNPKLEFGSIVYYVHALGEGSSITEYLLLSEPYQTDSGSWFVLAATRKYPKHPTEFSLLDCNVITNTYNQHKLFDDASKANAYLKLCKTR